MTVVFTLVPTLAVVFAVWRWPTLRALRNRTASRRSATCLRAERCGARRRRRGGGARAPWSELNSGCFPLLLGASSLAFHKFELDELAHTLDVFAGWLLVLHLCYRALSIAVLCTPPLLGLPHSAASAYRWWLRPLLSIGFVMPWRSWPSSSKIHRINSHSTFRSVRQRRFRCLL